MQAFIYYVASSLDGFIAGPQGDISRFIMQGDSLADYQSALSQFKTVIMGRHTYEFGYAYGLQAGQPAYQGMAHFIVSRQLQLPNAEPLVQVVAPDLAAIRKIKVEATTPVYVCGGGELAGWLLQAGLIDEVYIKLNPVILGIGTPLFGRKAVDRQLELLSSQSFDDGMQLLKYRVIK